MGKEKIKTHEEPTWKQQRKKLEAEARRTKMWTALGILAIVAVAVGLILITVRGIGPRKAAKAGKTEERHAISRVIGPGTSIIDGKDVQVMTFTVGMGRIERPITEKDKTLKKDDRVLLTYSENTVTGAKKIVDWEPFKESAEPTTPKK